jgi:hypothetical protein
MAYAKIDANSKQRIKREARDKLPFLIEFGNEADIIAYAKRWNPSLSAEELENILKLFLDAKRECARSRQSH